MRMRTGNRRSASIIISSELAAIQFIFRSHRRSHGRFALSSRLGLPGDDTMFAPCVAAPVSPPMSARSSSFSRSHHIGRPRTSLPVGTWRRRTRFRWSGTIPGPPSAAWI